MNKTDTRYPALDGLRGVAIAMVLLRHSLDVAIQSQDGSALALWLNTLLTYVYSGVELFFLLSGFLLGRILLEGPITNRVVGVFYWRRALRILPCYGLLLASFLILRGLPWQPASLRWALANDTIPFWSQVLLIQNHFIGILRNLGPAWLLITWSLAVEVQFYAVIPWLVRYLRAPVLMTVAILTVPLCVFLRWNLIHVANNPFGAVYSTVCRMDILFIGVLLAIIWHNPSWREKIRSARRLLGAAIVLFVVLFFTLPFGPAGTSKFVIVWSPSLLGLGFSLVLLWVLAAPEHFFSRALLARPWRHLGRISYFVYLFHFPAIFICYAWLSPSNENARIATTLLGLAATAGLAALSWRWFESRIVGLGHRVAYRQT